MKYAKQIIKRLERRISIKKGGKSLKSWKAAKSQKRREIIVTGPVA